jgi:hypothetical protein
MRKLKFEEGSTNNKITIAKDEIKINTPPDVHEDVLETLVEIARKLEKEYLDIRYTIRTKIRFEQDTFTIRYGGAQGNLHKHTKQLINYL